MILCSSEIFVVLLWLRHLLVTLLTAIVFKLSSVDSSNKECKLYSLLLLSTEDSNDAST